MADASLSDRALPEGIAAGGGPTSVLRRALDERHPGGGRVKAWVFVTHPGPSLLVTVVVVAAGGLLERRLPGQRTVAGLVLVMLPAQLGIGALNDWADAGRDRASKPYKPLTRGLMRRGAVAALAMAMLAISLATAGWLGGDVLLVDALGLGAGVGYDLGLKRTPLAVLAWWAGFAAVPLLAMVMSGRLDGAVAGVPLAGLASLALLLANGLPDSEADSATGARTLAVVLGDRRSRVAMAAALVVAAGYVLVLAVPLRQSAGAALAAAALLLGCALAAVAPALRALVFPALCLLVAVAAVSWLAALPVPVA